MLSTQPPNSASPAMLRSIRSENPPSASAADGMDCFIEIAQDRHDVVGAAADQHRLNPDRRPKQHHPATLSLHGARADDEQAKSQRRDEVHLRQINDQRSL